jgi:peptidoglycan/LPS O-acetylase OafA/YrhL
MESNHPAPSLSPIRSRNPWLDKLRGGAALMVVFFHLNAEAGFSGNVWREVAAYGNRGVEIFFLLSGFCIHAAAQRAKSVGEFAWHRWWRVFPPYYFSLVVVIGVAVARKLTVGVNDALKPPAGAVAWVANLTLTTSPVTAVPTVNWVYWTLSYEIAFYAVAALTLFWPRGRAAVFLSVTALSLIPGLAQLPGLFFLTHWSIFAMGAGLVEFMSGKRRAGSALVGLAFISVVVHHPPATTLIIAGTFLTIVASLRPNSFLRSSNWLSALGERSYSLYLLHVPLGVFLFAGLQSRLGFTNPLAELGYQVAIAALCVAASFLSYRFVEQPAIAFAKNYHPSWLRPSRRSHPVPDSCEQI